MRNRPIFKTIQQLVATQGYTAEQVADATPAQVATVAKLDAKDAAEAERYWPGIKRLCLLDMQNQQDAADMDGLKATAKVWLDANFPGWQAERGREGDKPYVTIWLKGKPDTPQAVEGVARG